MSMRRTPPLSLRGSREVLEEMAKPPAGTPERRATFARVRALQPLIDKALDLNRLAGSEPRKCPNCGSLT